MQNYRRYKVLCVIFSILLLCASFSQSSQTVHALTVQEKINNASKSKKDALEQTNAAKEKKKSELAQKETIEREIDILETELSAIDTLISEADEKIAQKEAEIAEYEEKIQENEEEFRARLRATDESNVGTYIDILLGSVSFSDFLARVQTIQEIAEYDQGIINQMITLQNGVKESKLAIETTRQEQVEARGMVADKKSQLDAKRQEKDAIISAINADIAKYEKAYKEAEQQEQALKRSLQSSLSSSSSGPKFVGGKFLWPTASTNITSPYGYRNHPVLKTRKFHSGVDVGASSGASIMAANDGTVRLSGWNGGYGNCIIIDHGGGFATLYAHNSANLVSTGQKVTRGQVIGRVGSTGMSTGPHLHFEILVNGSTVDPMSYFK